MGKCISDYETPVSCYDRLKNFRGDASDLFPMSSYVSSERNFVFSVASSLTRNCLFEMCSLVNILLIWKEMETRETVF